MRPAHMSMTLLSSHSWLLSLTLALMRLIGIQWKRCELELHTLTHGIAACDTYNWNMYGFAFHLKIDATTNTSVTDQFDVCMRAYKF